MIEEKTREKERAGEERNESEIRRQKGELSGKGRRGESLVTSHSVISL